MKFISILSMLLIISCSSAPKFKKATGTGEMINGVVYIPAVIKYKYPEAVQKNVRDECTEISSTMASSVKTNGEKMGLSFKMKKNVGANQKGNNVEIEILNAISSGNAFTGHNKTMTIKASLYANKKLVDDIELTRKSGGGIGGGFKGSCSVLGRTAQKLGEDIALWVNQYNGSKKTAKK